MIESKEEGMLGTMGVKKRWQEKERQIDRGREREIEAEIEAES